MPRGALKPDRQNGGILFTSVHATNSISSNLFAESGTFKNLIPVYTATPPGRDFKGVLYYNT